MGIFYIGGLYIYLKRIPEKWYPGKFDILVKKKKKKSNNNLDFINHFFLFQRVRAIIYGILQF